MKRTFKILIGVIVIALLATAAALRLGSSRERGVEVRMEEVVRRDLASTVTASGNIRARRSLDMRPDVMGRVIELSVKEGENVEQGQVLLRIDPSQLQAAVARAQAGLSQSQAQVAQQRSNLIQAQREHERIAGLQRRDSSLVSRQQMEDAEIRLEVAQANLSSARFGVDQAQATLSETLNQLEKATILAPISGKVTRLNIEEGETAVVGTMNNPGTLLLTISDLSVMEAVMAVDETSIPEISVGDSALIELDAFPQSTFVGVVTEIGNSAIRSPSAASGGQTASIDFEVVLTLLDPPVTLRPDLSATADIITDRRNGVLTIPIIALSVRDRPVAAAGEASPSGSAATPVATTTRRRVLDLSEEGVFVVRDGTVRFVPVAVGITGAEYFEVLSGLEEGDIVVSGPYQRIRELKDGDAVHSAESATAASPGTAG